MNQYRQAFTALLYGGVLIAYSAKSFADEQPMGRTVTGGDSIELLNQWPAIAKAPKSGLATFEVLLKPDQAAIDRPRSFVMTLSNRGGRDSAGISITFSQGKVVGSILGFRLMASKVAAAEKWTHVALTINTKTINKQAKLWVDGQLVGERLVLEKWPSSFEVAKMLSDHWNQGRVYSGELGDIRFSRVIRYEKKFTPPSSLPNDKETSFHIKAVKLSSD